VLTSRHIYFHESVFPFKYLSAAILDPLVHMVVLPGLPARHRRHNNHVPVACSTPSPCIASLPAAPVPNDDFHCPPQTHMAPTRHCPQLQTQPSNPSMWHLASRRTATLLLALLNHIITHAQDSIRQPNPRYANTATTSPSPAPSFVGATLREPDCQQDYRGRVHRCTQQPHVDTRTPTTQCQRHHLQQVTLRE
jgi:hypothetical protein